MLLLTLLLAFGLRLYRLVDKPVWWDEGWSVWLARRDFLGIAVRTASDEHPPLHYWLLHLWNGLADPYVYHANVIVKDADMVTDAVQQPLGFRFFSMDPNTGFSLNGKSYPLRGVCMHQDHKDKGGQFNPAAIDQDFAIIKEIGANVVRFAHYQHSQHTYDNADQAGLVTNFGRVWR